MRAEYAAEGWVRPGTTLRGCRPCETRSLLRRHSVAWETWVRLPATGVRSAPGHGASWALAWAPAGAASATTAAARTVAAWRRENMPPHRAVPRPPFSRPLRFGRLSV